MKDLATEVRNSCLPCLSFDFDQKGFFFGFADYIANGLFSESFGLPEMFWRAPVHLDIFHVIILCETDLLFNKLYLQIYYRFVIQI